VGFDNIPAGRRPAYLLTTVSQPFEAMAHAVAAVFRRQVDELPTPYGRVLMAGTLIERGSAQLLPDSSAR
jgi:DNA-binding LacI/PurR family transcriptional regulator